MSDSAALACAIVPFDRTLADEIQRLVGRLDATQRAWLSGYLLGTVGASAPQPDGRPAATILYGSHSGNGEALATRLAEALRAAGVSCTTLDMLDCRKRHLEEARHLFVIVSTHGEGDPPDRARPLYELLHGRKAPTLAHLKYSVLALGDSSYEKFCETGRRFDAQFEALGARRVLDRVECDVDFQASADRWIAALIPLTAAQGARTSAVDVTRPGASVATAYTRRNPWTAPVLANLRLTAPASTKDVRHLELSIDGAGIHYEPGDALGVVPRNHEADVLALLEHLPFAAQSAVTVAGAETSLQAALRDHLDIGPLNRPLLERYAALTRDRELARLLDTDASAPIDEWLHGRHLVDLVSHHPPAADLASFVQILRPLAPRLYSIASSPRATPGEVHLTVRVVEYESHARQRRGVVSAALAQANGVDASVSVYPHRNAAFRLPSDPAAPIIMVGPGTGVAPFRAFLAEREAVAATGRNWLFFGDRTLRSDFLYHTEWLDWRRRGVLHRLDVAFSRDAQHKTYVQHRIAERGKDVYAWLRDGAYFYVCGDAQHMAPDVDVALRDVVRVHGGMNDDAVEEFMLDLQRNRRYQKDVY